jgi:hypothetical protein
MHVISWAHEVVIGVAIKNFEAVELVNAVLSTADIEANMA